MAVDRLRASADELRQEHPVYAEQMCAEIEDKHAEFNRMARNAIPGRPYRFLGALRD